MINITNHIMMAEKSQLNLNRLCIYLFILVYLWSSGILTQDLMLARQAFYYLSHTPRRVGSYVFAQGQPWTMILLLMGNLHSWDHRHMPPCLAYLVRWCLVNLPRLALNHHLPKLFLPCSCDYRSDTTCPVNNKSYEV
jgi:hypothetical protein